MLSEVLQSFLKAMALILAGGLGYVVASIWPAPIDDLPGEKGSNMIPAWGVIYFVMLFFLEKNKNLWKPDDEKQKGRTSRPSVKKS